MDGLNKQIHKEIQSVTFHDPFTIVRFTNGNTQVVKAGKDDNFSPEFGLAMAIVRELFPSRNAFKKLVQEFKESQ